MFHTNSYSHLHPFHLIALLGYSMHLFWLLLLSVDKHFCGNNFGGFL